MVPNPPKLILPIQYLRGIAALMVVWHHGTEQMPGLAAYFPLRFGTSGVDVFFVISGFIMVMTTVGKSITPIDFIARRFIRVVPLYWVLTLALVAGLLAAPSVFRSTVLTPGSLIQSLLFIPHLSPSRAGMVWPILVPGWTLNYEIFLYAVFAASLAFRQRLAVLASTMIILVAAGYLLGPFAHPIPKTFTDPILLEFVAGAVIGHLWIAGHVKLSWPASIIGMLVGIGLLVLRDSPSLASYTKLVGAVLLIVGSLNVHMLRWRNGLLLVLGDSSYSIYLTHIFALGAWRWIWTKLHLGTPDLPTGLLFMFLALTFCVIVGWLSYRWIETPVLNWMNGLLRKRRVAKVAVVPRNV